MSLLYTRSHTDENGEISKIHEGPYTEEQLKENLHLDLNELLASKFKCSKCEHEECAVQEIAVTGTGLSKLMDIQHHHYHYLFVSCLNCAHVEVYNPNILQGKTKGTAGTLLDNLSDKKHCIFVINRASKKK